MPTVQNIVTDSGSNPVPNAIVRIQLIAGPVLAQPGYTGTTTIGPAFSLNADGVGAWSANLIANDLIVPANTCYRINEAGFVSTIVVPNGPGPYTLPSILTTPPESLPLRPSTVPTFSWPGALAVAQGTARIYNDGPATLSIQYVRTTAGTPPTGAALVTDVKVNGVTIFTIPAHRPAIAAGANTSGKVTTIDARAWAPGQYLTVDIAAVGSVSPGSDLTVQIYAS